MAVLVEAMNTARVKLGLTVYTYAGTVATPNTIPAITSAGHDQRHLRRGLRDGPRQARPSQGAPPQDRAWHG